VAGALVTDAAREAVLGRVRAALGSASPAAVEIPRAYRQAGRRATGVERADGVARFCERVGEYRARVQRVCATDLDALVFELLASARVLVPMRPPSSLEGLQALGDDPPLAPRELAGADAVLTGCALAIARTGTIVLDGSASCGRWALTLVPDHHVCIVRAEQIVGDVPDAIAALQRTNATARPIMLISGPSATSDIELERVEGVHGPRKLEVVVVT
jgi:L-lactate dehydrogenase complex protein LldG